MAGRGRPPVPAPMRLQKCYSLRLTDREEQMAMELCDARGHDSLQKLVRALLKEAYQREIDNSVI